MSAPDCPRCGYDQSGAMAAWERQQPPQCPVSGLCSECGLEFAWRDLLNPAFARQDRYFEHAQRGVALAFFHTFWAALRPWALWRSVRMEHGIVWRRLALFAVVGLALTAALAAAALTRCAWLFRWARWQSPYVGSFTFWSDERAFERLSSWPPDLLSGGALAWSAASTGGLLSPQLAVTMLALAAAPGCILLLPATLRRVRVRRSHVLRVGAYAAATLPLALAAPVVLATLAGITASADAAWEGKGYRLQGLGVWWEHNPWMPALACTWAWLALWWWIAAGRYLRLPHAAGIGVAVATLAMLIGVALIALVPGGAAWMERGA